ncbi:MAG TPA: EF-hand domain-containing protein [Azonexus sp.]|nr:EF-hand domain-containing protein [Azonexus sp.]
MTRHTLATLILLAAMPLAATAAEPTPSVPDSGRSAATGSPAEAPPMFKELDKNHDGQISQAEAKRSADISARFSAIDTNKDKQISLTEWQSDEKSHARGAAGVSGESREPSPQTTTPAKPDMNKGY